MEKLDQVIEKICDLIIEEANNDWDDSKNTNIKELADAMALVANAIATIERGRNYLPLSNSHTAE